MRYRAVLIAAVLVAFATATPANAQRTISLVPNARLRVSAPAYQLDSAIALFVEEHGDSVTLRLLASRQTLTLRRSDLTLLQVSRGQSKNRLGGAAVGLLVGALGGGVFGSVGGGSCNDGEFYCGPEVEAAVSAFALGVIGAVVGGAIGISRREQWEAVPITVGVGRAAAGSRHMPVTQVGARLRF